jgi:LysR family glycine cleavage system transcriptional activator
MVGKSQRVRLPPLNSLRAFEAAARYMNFREAAEELHVTQSAISRHIKGLEDYFGFALFKRLPRSIELTEHGRSFAGPLQEAFESLHRATEIVLREKGLTTLNINVLPTFAMKWLIPRLCNFTAANPNIEVRMVTSIHPVDFRNEDNDVAIRVGPTLNHHRGPKSPIDLVMTQQWLDVRSIPILSDSLVPVCSPSLLANGPPLVRPEDLRNHRLIHMASRDKGWPFWLKAMGLEEVEAEHYTAYGHYFMAIEAATEGKGVALVPEVLVEAELRSKSLVALFGGKAVASGAYYLLCRETDWKKAKIVRFREWLAKEVGSTDPTTFTNWNIEALQTA